MGLTRGTARRYAEAAFQVAERDGAIEDWLAALSLAQVRLTEPGAARLLGSPAIAVAVRIEILDRVLGHDVSGAPRNLLALLVRRGRFDQLTAVVREFGRLHARREGIVEADVTSAVALEPDELPVLRERLVAMTGRDVRMRLAVDPMLLGGVQVRIGDTLIDGSVRGRLERLRATLSTTAI